MVTRGIRIKRSNHKRLKDVKELFKGKWETIETRTITYTENRVGTEVKREATMFVQRHTKSGEYRTFSKDQKRQKEVWDFDYVRTHILEKDANVKCINQMIK